MTNRKLPFHFRSKFKLFLPLFTFFFILPENLFADSQSIQDSMINIKIDTRFDNEYKVTKNIEPTDEKYKRESGFLGKYFMLYVDGNINRDFSYSIRHRVSKASDGPKEFLSSTDWLNVTYKIDNRFSLTAGKQMCLIGTYEYDCNPVDVFFATDFWNHVSPFQAGVNAGYHSKNGKHDFYGQITNSIFSTKANESIYAYSLLWYGNITPKFNTIYSMNMIEYEKNHFINYIALGNRFMFDKVDIIVDYINRYAGKNTGFFNDFSFAIDTKYYLTDKFGLFAKAGYDQNKAQNNDAEFVYDRCVLPGTKRSFYGFGALYHPIINKKDNLRVHAYWCSTNKPLDQQSFDIGLRWLFSVYSKNYNTKL